MTSTPKMATTPVPLKIVGGNHFGRYSKVSVEETCNMIVSDKGLVPYAGFAAVLSLVTNGVGRGAYVSIAGGIAIVVAGSSVIQINTDLTYEVVGTLKTSSGDVFINENNNYQIAITDYSNIYVYSYGTSPATFSISTTSSPGANQFQIPADLTNPGYITFQNTRLIVPATGKQKWYLSGNNDAAGASSWSNSGAEIPAQTGAFQTKSDTILAAVRFPGRGNLLFLFGSVVVESWTDQGLALFPYAKSTSFNLDYGCLNASTIADNEEYVVWLSQNEKSGPALSITDGSSIKRISTDGIDYRLSNLTDPTDCYGFFFRQDGHLIYQFAFPTDNLSYLYDMNTGEFFTVTDENLNYHPAKKVIFFNNTYYFVSNKDGKFYEFDTSITKYIYSLPTDTTQVVREIPRYRICPPIRLTSQQSYIAKNLGFTIEQGQPNTITEQSVPLPFPYTVLTTEDGKFLTTETGSVLQTTAFMGTMTNYISSSVVDLSISRDGGKTFGNRWRQNMNDQGEGKSLFIYRRLGRVNDSSCKLDFIGFDRFVVFDGELEMYQ